MARNVCRSIPLFFLSFFFLADESVQLMRFSIESRSVIEAWSCAIRTRLIEGKRSDVVSGLSNIPVIVSLKFFDHRYVYHLYINIVEERFGKLII